jgi:hypothetical protein
LDAGGAPRDQPVYSWKLTASGQRSKSIHRLEQRNSDLGSRTPALVLELGHNRNVPRPKRNSAAPDPMTNVQKPIAPVVVPVQPEPGTVRGRSQWSAPARRPAHSKREPSSRLRDRTSSCFLHFHWVSPMDTCADWLNSSQPGSTTAVVGYCSALWLPKFPMKTQSTPIANALPLIDMVVGVAPNSSDKTREKGPIAYFSQCRQARCDTILSYDLRNKSDPWPGPRSAFSASGSRQRERNGFHSPAANAHQWIQR